MGYSPWSHIRVRHDLESRQQFVEINLKTLQVENTVVPQKIGRECIFKCETDRWGTSVLPLMDLHVQRIGPQNRISVWGTEREKSG